MRVARTFLLFSAAVFLIGITFELVSTSFEILQVSSSLEQTKNRPTGSIPDAHTAVPEPLKVLREYISWHSVNALKESGLKGRKFLIAAYQCPHEAGNVLQYFLNNVVAAIVTNRTLVYRYNTGFGTQEESCSPILHRAEWIPSLDDVEQLWREDLNDATAQLPVQALHTGRDLRKLCLANFNLSSLPECAKLLRYDPSKPAMVATDLTDFRFLELESNVACSFNMFIGWSARYNFSSTACTDYLQGLFPQEFVPGKQITRRIMQEGHHFLYGMLFHELLPLTSELVNSVGRSIIDPGAFSIGVHSRHADPNDDGSDIRREKRCLEHLMKRKAARLEALGKSNETKCQLAIMADRQMTVEQISRVAHEWGCESFSAQLSQLLPTRRRLGIRAEHGPFAGAGFFKDLALTIQARDALMITGRSSSALVLELTVYKQTMRNYQGNDPRPTGEVCFFPRCDCVKWQIKHTG